MRQAWKGLVLGALCMAMLRGNAFAMAPAEMKVSSDWQIEVLCRTDGGAQVKATLSVKPPLDDVPTATAIPGGFEVLNDSAINLASFSPSNFGSTLGHSCFFRCKKASSPCSTKRLRNVLFQTLVVVPGRILPNYRPGMQCEVQREFGNAAPAADPAVL